MAKILVVEDNKIINMTHVKLLKSQGYEAFSAYTAEEALTMFSDKKYDLILLDLHLPKMSGYTFLQVIRKKSDIPVIINTAFASTKSRVKLINVGASDFIEKSMNKEEILKSIEILLEQKAQMDENKKKTINLFDLQIDFKNHSVEKNGNLLDLTSKEFEILKILLDNPRYVFSRKQLYMLVWAEEYDSSVDNTINVHIRRLRNKIERNPKQPEIIETVFKHGYRLGKPSLEILEEMIRNQE